LREGSLDMVGGSDTGQSGTDDAHVDVFGHPATPAEATCAAELGADRLSCTTARPPLRGALATPRECQRSPPCVVGTSDTSRSKVRSTTSISMFANAAPGQRRVPPPNGIHWYRSGFVPMNRCGSNTPALPNSDSSRCINAILTTTFTPSGNVHRPS